MFLAKDRLEFTRESLRALRKNTNWSLVDKFVLYDDGSKDGTLEFLQAQAAEMGAELRQTGLGSAVLAQNHFIERSTADFVAKCDNDAMYPPEWLEVGLGVLDRNPQLDVLCLEERGLTGPLPYSYEGAVEGDGLFIARGSLFRGRPLPTAIRKYWGWETWMREYSIKTGWLKPSIPVFLLDRVPIDPWRTLSDEYTERGLQRALGGAVRRYDMSRAYLWEWCGWPPTGVKVYRATRPIKFEGAVIEPGDIIPSAWKPSLVEGLLKRGWAKIDFEAAR
jgi:glycosyltransferase involved in cell wall biosynthesis